MTVPRGITSLQRAMESTFSATIVIKRKTRTGDSAGGAVETWVTVDTVKGSFESYPIRDVERENTVRVQALSYWAFVLPADADVRPADRLVVGSRTFEIAGGGLSSMAIVGRFLAVEIQ